MVEKLPLRFPIQLKAKLFCIDDENFVSIKTTKLFVEWVNAMVVKYLLLLKISIASASFDVKTLTLTSFGLGLEADVGRWAVEPLLGGGAFPATLAPPALRGEPEAAFA